MSAPEPTRQHLGAAATRLLMAQATEQDLELFGAAARATPQRLIALGRQNRIMLRLLSALSEHGIELRGDLRAEQRYQQERTANGWQTVADVVDIMRRHKIPFMVIKTLEHHPDLGGDVDLYCQAAGSELGDMCAAHFSELSGSRSLCDTLARKRAYRLNGSELKVEIHHACLGQIGEHRRLASELFDQRQRVEVAGIGADVPSVEGRLIITLLQRLYRHFSFRICDVLDVAQYLDHEAFTWNALTRLTNPGGITGGVRQGVASVRQLLRDLDITAPDSGDVPDTSQRGFPMTFSRGCFRFPLAQVVPGLYAGELLQCVRRGALRQAGRLGLLTQLMMVVGLNRRLLPRVGLWKHVW